MSLAIRDTSTIPPEDWTYEVPGFNDGTRNVASFVISTKNYGQLYPQIVDYCQANQLPVPSPQAVTDQCCERLHIACYDTETHEPLINKIGLPFIPTVTSCCTKIPVAPAPSETI